MLNYYLGYLKLFQLLDLHLKYQKLNHDISMVIQFHQPLKYILYSKQKINNISIKYTYLFHIYIILYFLKKVKYYFQNFQKHFLFDGAGMACVGGRTYLCDLLLSKKDLLFIE